MVYSTDSSSIPRIAMKFNLRATGGAKYLMIEARPKRRRRMFSSTQDDEIQHMRRLRYQNTLKRRERLEELSNSDPEYAKALDIKECMLEVQGVLMGKLATKQNHFKELAILPGICNVDFEERVKKTEEVIKALQY